MTTAPIPTGKIRGSLRDVMPKLRNFVGAVKVTTPSGKGGLLVDMGRPVAAYLAREGVLHRGKASLDLLEKEDLAEFEILRYDEEQFREAMIICDNRGLLLEGAKEPAAVAPVQARDTKPREEENVLSAMMKRFGAPKAGERPEPVLTAPRAEPAPSPTPAAPRAEEEPRPRPQPSPPEGKIPAVPERREVPVPPPPAESELSAIIRRLRESGKVEKEPAPQGAKTAEIPSKLQVPETGESVRAAGLAIPAGEGPRAAAEERIHAEPAAPGGRSPEVSGVEGREERVRVDLGKMMKRIKRLDITSIRRELQEGTEEGEAAGVPAAAPPQPAGEAVPPAGVPVRASPPQAETKGKSDIDELKAFIQRLEVLEEPVEAPPPERRVLARLGLKPPAEEAPVPPARREPGAPVPEKGKIIEELPGAGETGPVQKPPEERVMPRPAEPDTKAKIASLLRRSGLVKPPAEEPAAEPATGIPARPGVPEEGEEIPAPALAEEVEIRIPKIQRKKVEITRVPRRPEKPLREPPLMDEKRIQKILKQPGVIAVSTFFEGFAVQSAGRADFEQVAANAEDLFRAGKKIAREIDIGPLNQIILETGKGKLIIAPHGDLNVCIFTEPDANLGLIRVAIKSMQVEKDR